MQSRLTLELIWWVVTAIVTVLILLPILTNIGSEYPFYVANILFIVVFITFTRYIFLVKYTFFADLAWFKTILVFLPIPIFFYFIDSMYDFQRFLDEEGVISILGGVNADDQYSLSKYVQYQKLFFGTGAILTLILLPIRMIMSIWRRKNRGTY